MPPRFQDFLLTAYAEPFPKRFLAVAVFAAIFFVLSRLVFVRRMIRNTVSLRTGVLAFGLFMAALALRIPWLHLAPTYFPATFSQSPQPDENSLIGIYAYGISQRGLPFDPDGSLQTRRPVGYLYFLGLLYKFVGYHSDFFKFIQILMSSLLVALLFVLAFEVFRRKGVALGVGILTAIYPVNLYSVTVPLDEWLFFLTIFGAFYFIARNLREKKIGHTIKIGILLGLATSVRTYPLVMPFIFLALYLFFGLPVKKALLQTALCFAFIFGISSPWAYATWRHYDRPCFFTTYGVIGFYGTLNDRASWHNGYMPLTAEEGGKPEFFNEKNPVKAAGIAQKLALEWVLENPLKTLKLALMRNAALYGFQLDDGMTSLVQAHTPDAKAFVNRRVSFLIKAAAWSYSFVALLALAGGAALVFDKKHFFVSAYPAMSLFFLVFAYWCFIHGLFFPMRKYRWFADLLLFFPASFFLAWLWNLKQPQPRLGDFKTGVSVRG